jgi:predicted extracellular nuclease
MKSIALATCLTLAAATSALADVRITEFMYSGAGGEFVELTNTGAVSVNLAGWSYDDDSRTPGAVDLSAFGIVGPGESVVLAELDEPTFVLEWGLSGVKVIGGNTTNLGRNDEINLFDATSTLIDRLTFGDQNLPGTIRTQNVSGWAYVSGPGPYGDVDASWVLSAVGDVQASSTSLGGDIGNPGRYRVVPEPTTLTLLAGAAITALRRRR